jgi:hypothetical protein
MPNRIFSKTGSFYGNEVSSRELVLHYLKKGEMTFGEIKRNLAGNGVKYADNKGLALLLNGMQKRREIRKHKVPGKTYPVYYMTSKMLNTTAEVAREFNHEVFFKIENFPYLPKEDYESPEEYVLRRLVNLYGLYMLYVVMKSWKYTSEDKSQDKNIKNRAEWFRHTLPMKKDSYLFEETVTLLAGIESFSEDVALICFSKKKSAKLADLEKTLGMMYPGQVKFFDNIMEGLEEKAAATRKWIGDATKRRNRAKRHSRKRP